MKLAGKHIVVGITGSIAAYKAAMLIRLLVSEGAEVKVIMTKLGKKFITPLTVATLSNNPVLVDFFDPENGQWNSHVKLGLWADLYIIAPATANSIAKMANGIADNLLLTTYLSAKCPVMIAPAMDLDMYRHPATQKNIETLAGRGNIIIEPTEGELASGLSGKGRMQEPQQIASIISDFLCSTNKLSGLTAMVTSGPTHEQIDPVRFIGNNSSGKMGNAIALELARNGASVKLISGPVAHLPNHPLIETISVTSADDMLAAAIDNFPKADIAVLAAAVADFTPENPAKTKIKRGDGSLNIQLRPTTDIAATLGKNKRSNQLMVGFALETNNEVENAKRKLREKNMDLIVLNSLNSIGAGFGYDTNKISVINKLGEQTDFELKLKTDVARDIVQLIQKQLDKQKPPK